MSEIDPSWDLYRTFLAVLTEGSLSAAARDLGLTQPTVGRHVDALEQAVGFELFMRTPQGLRPTEAALALKPYAETMAASAAALRRAATGTLLEVSGTVRISASEVIGVEVLPPILAALQEEHPRLVIELSPSDAVEDLLRQQADIAVRMVEPAQDALVTQRIGDIPLGFHAHRRYLERHGTPAQIEDLAVHRLIGFDRQTAFIRAMMKRAPLLTSLNFTFRADSNLAQMAAMRAGIGIGICQIAIARRDPDLVHILPDIGFPLGTWVAMHETLKSTPRCRATFDALVAGLRTYVAATKPAQA